MFMVTNLNMRHVAAGTGEPILDAHFDGTALVAIYNAMTEVSQMYSNIAVMAQNDGNDEEAAHFHEQYHDAAAVLSVLEGAMDAIASLDVCEGPLDEDVSEALSDENLVKVLGMFASDSTED